MAGGGSSAVKHFFAFLGRILFAIYFLFYGIFNITSFNSIIQSYSNISHVEVLVVITIITQLLGGILLVFGWYTRLAAFILFIAVVLMTWLEFLVVPIHADTVSAAMATFMHFIDNLGYAGATLYFMAMGAGALSLDFFRGRHKVRAED